MSDDIFDDLYVLDMANNHQGILEHGLKIIREHGKVVKKHGVKAGIKFQYRQLDTFIHPDFKDRDDIKHIPRFMGTKMSMDDFKKMVDEVKAQGMISICTPFDEESVDVIIDHGIDIIKVASCSAQDWPLLEKISTVSKPIIVSTGGLNTSQLDKLYSFFTHRHANFAMMHCVGIYPTPNEKLILDRIDYMKNRYRDVKIGWSTHENQDDTTPVHIAIAKGAKLLERHIGFVTDEISLNKYSSTPEQLDKWISAAEKARKACHYDIDNVFEEETSSLKTLQRGVYAKKDISKGDVIKKEDIFFAMPLQKGQMISGDFKEGLLSYKKGKRDISLIADQDYKKNDPISSTDKDDDVNSEVFEIIHQVKGLLHEARIAIGKDFRVELSHHYGIEKFKETGAVIIDCVNREYCKKLIVQIPGQKHPTHYHKIKEETFQVLHGELIVSYGGKQKVLKPGDQLLVEPGVPHSFTTETGVVVEEVSTTHIKGDSVYEDSNVSKDRKTPFELW